MARRPSPKATLAKTIAAQQTSPAPEAAVNETSAANAAATMATRPVTDDPVSVDTLLGSSILPALIEIGDAQVQLGEIVAAAHQKSGLSLEDWNALEDAARELLLDAEIKRRLAALEPASKPAAEPDEDLHLGRIWTDEEIDDQVAGAIAHFRDAVARNREQGIALLTNARLATRKTDEALLALLVEFGAVVVDAPPAPPPIHEELPDAVPEGKIRIKVRGPQAGRRRLGRQFAPEAVTLDVTTDELAALRADAMLQVKLVEPE